MAIPISSPNGLILTNAVVTIQAQAASKVEGLTVETYTTVVASGVDVLMTMFSASRGGETFGTDTHVDKCRITGLNAGLVRADVRFLVTTAPPTMTELTNTYWRVEGNPDHPAGAGGLLNQRYSADCTLLNLPILN